MKNILYAVFFIATFASCSSSVDVGVYNTSDMPMSVKIDTLLVEVLPQELVWLEMGEGEHSLEMPDGKKQTIMFTANENLLNIAGGRFLLSRESYSAESDIATQSAVKETLLYGGQELEAPKGDYKILDGLIIPVTWQYWPSQKTPEFLEIEDGDPTYVYKLRDSTEFVSEMNQYFEREMQQLLDAEANAN